MFHSVQRWLVFVCLMSYQFSPAYTVRKTSKPQSRRTKTDKQDEKPINGASFIGSNMLKELTFSSYGTTFGSLVLEAIAGCKAAVPSIQDDFKAFQIIRNKYDAVKKAMKETSSQALLRQKFANESFYQYLETRILLSGIANEQTVVLKHIAPQALEVINNISKQIESIFEQAKESNQELNVLEIEETFAEKLDVGLESMISGANIAISGLKELWDKYLKTALIGINISAYIDKYKLKVAKPTSEEDNKSLKAILNKRVLGETIAQLQSKLKSFIRTKAAPRFKKARNLVDTAKAETIENIRPGTRAYEVWTTVETFQNCKLIEVDGPKSVANTAKYVKKFKKQISKLKNADKLVKQVWDDVRKMATADSLLEELTILQQLIVDGAFSKNDPEKQDIANKIQAYIESSDLYVDDESSKQKLSDNQKALNEILRTVTDTWSCFKIKAKQLEFVAQECSRGSNSFSYIYKKSINYIPVEPDWNCANRTGMAYITIDSMRKAWDSLAKNNMAIDEMCLLNNKHVAKQIEKMIRDGINDPQEVAKIIVNQDDIAYSIDEIKAIIDKLKAGNPSNTT